MTRPDLERPLERITSLIDELSNIPDAAAREQARGLVQAVLDLHRVSLRRLVELIATRAGAALVADLARDDAVALLLALHGLHPEDVAARVAGAVEALRPRLAEEGVEIEVTDVGEDTARVRLRPIGTVAGSGAALRTLIETAIARSAPEIAAVEIAGLDSSDVPLARLLKR